MKKYLSFTAFRFLFGIGFAFAAGFVFAIYLADFKTISNEEIWEHGWLGGGCYCLSDVLLGGITHIDGDSLYDGTIRRGRIVERKYRVYADSYLIVVSETGEVCRYWEKGKRSPAVL